MKNISFIFSHSYNNYSLLTFPSILSYSIRNRHSNQDCSYLFRRGGSKTKAGFFPILLQTAWQIPFFCLVVIPYSKSCTNFNKAYLVITSQIFISDLNSLLKNIFQYTMYYMYVNIIYYFFSVPYRLQ